MKLDIPYYKNDGPDGNQCFQVAMKCALEYFLGKSLSLSELDTLTGRKTGYWTWSAQIVPVLYDLGLEVTYYSVNDPTPYLGGEDALRSQFGKDADVVIQNTDIPVLMSAIKRLLDSRLFTQRQLEFQDIEKLLQMNAVPLLLIDRHVLNAIEGPYQGHFVTVTGFDEQSVYYHESGPSNPESHRKVSKQNFINAWSVPATERDAVIVYGKRN